MLVEQLSFSMQNVFRLREIEKECFGRDAWSIAALTGEFQNDFSHFFALEQNEVIVGYACVRIMYEEAQVCNIAVMPQNRRCGIGTQLVSALCDFSQEQGCNRIELEVNTENEAACLLYQKSGFQVAGVRKNFYGKSRFKSRDAYTLVKQLKTEQNDN